VRILIGIFAIWIIVLKLDDYFLKYNFKDNLDVQFGLIFIVFLLLFINWGLEAFKWQYVIGSIQKINFLKAFKLTITGITIGLITPNRIGEIPGRALLLNNKENLKDLVVKTSVGAFSQLIITFSLGTIAASFLLSSFNFPFNSNYILSLLIGITFFLLIFYFYNNILKNVLYKIPFFKNQQLLSALETFNVKELAIVLVISLLRYIIFSVQYYLILQAFGLTFSSYTKILLIPFCFLITSSIPTIVISEIGVRGSVALFVFGIISDNNLAILSASVLLWVMNVALPALFGLFFINQFKIVSQK
jgi:uncharacterized membrane protein YbhN (UPF0104 family)